MKITIGVLLSTVDKNNFGKNLRKFGNVLFLVISCTMPLHNEQKKGLSVIIIKKSVFKIMIKGSEAFRYA